MRFLTFIFALYIMLLPCLPCADSDECNEVGKTESIITTAGNHDHQHENEACSPFCSCACCGHIVASGFQIVKWNINKPSIRSAKPISYHTISLPSDYYGNIWQPPQLS